MLTYTRDYPMTFNAGQEYTIDGPGRYFHIFEAADPLWISINDGPWIKRRARQGNAGEIDRLRVKSDTAQSVLIALSSHPINDGRGDITGATINAQWTAPDKHTALPDVVVGAGLNILIAAANPGRRKLTVRAALTNDPAAEPRLRHDSAATAAGVPLLAGEVREFEGEAAIYCYNDSAAAVTFYVSETVKV